jgi:hypothetical protein
MSRPFSNLPTLRLSTFCGRAEGTEHRIHLQISQEHRYIELHRREVALLIKDLEKFLSIYPIDQQQQPQQPEK